MPSWDASDHAGAPGFNFLCMFQSCLPDDTWASIQKHNDNLVTVFPHHETIVTGTGKKSSCCHNRSLDFATSYPTTKGTDMRFDHILKFAAALCCAATVSFSAAAADITGAGATFPYPIYAKWAEAYKSATGN